ncbi:MAG TPA: PilZ domain-containing protein [Kofleriaceae bacterium]|nr:PilZ domain-containing protein [Kofleriaceae bacterium]
MKATKRTRPRAAAPAPEPAHAPGHHPAPLPATENRCHLRFNKAFPVVVESELYGDTPAVARNISAGGMFVEMADPLPLGSVVLVSFRAAGGGDLSVRAEVKHHYCFNYGGAGGEPALARGIGLRFLEFFPHGEQPIDLVPADRRALH